MSRRLGAVGSWLSVMFAVGSSVAMPSEAAPYGLIEVVPSVVVAVHGNGSNLGCVALDTGLVFIDTGLSTRTARRFRHEMEARFDRRTLALVLTHAHLDHVLGMAAFDDVPVWAAAAGRPRWESLVAATWDEPTVAAWTSVYPSLPDELPDASLRMPTDWLDDETDLGPPGQPLALRRTGGHSVDSSSLVVAVDGMAPVVFAGDLVQAGRRPYFGEPDTDFDAWIGALRRWQTIAVGKVCPGHGPVIDAGELEAIRVWFEAIAAAVAEMKRGGSSFEEVLAAGDLPAGYWPDDGAPPRWWALSLKRLYDAS